MFSSSSLHRIPHRMFYPPVYLKLTLSLDRREFFACIFVFLYTCSVRIANICLFLYLVLCICVYRSYSCSYGLSPFLVSCSGIVSLVFIFLCLLVFSFFVWLLCCIIVFRTLWFWLCFCVLADYSSAFSLGTSAYLIIWITTSACLLTLLLPCPIKTVSWYIVHLGPPSLSPPSQYVTLRWLFQSQKQARQMSAELWQVLQYVWNTLPANFLTKQQDILRRRLVTTNIDVSRDGLAV